MPKIEAILLAAGESRRMGYPKPLLKIGELTFLEHLSALLLNFVPHLTIVLGAHLDEIRAVIPPDPRISTVINPQYHRGQLSSLKAALRSLAAEPDAILVHLVDHPSIRPETVEKMVAEFRSASLPILIPRCNGRRGHPVIFARSMFAELKAAPEAEGARVVINRDRSRVGYVEVNDPA